MGSATGRGARDGGAGGAAAVAGKGERSDDMHASETIARLAALVVPLRCFGTGSISCATAEALGIHSIKASASGLALYLQVAPSVSDASYPCKGGIGGLRNVDESADAAGEGADSC